jgi:thiosulfate dehydrogenase
MTRVLMGFILGCLCVVAGGLVWLSYGTVPVAVADPPLAFERRITGIPLEARIQREMVVMTPIKASEANLISGAHIYVDKCAVCHGLHGKPSDFGSSMYPHAPALWEQHRNSTVVGVSDDAPGATFWKIANGVRLTGMPSYRGLLSDEEMWQVALLLSSADKPLPPEALKLLRVEAAPTARSSVPAVRTPYGEKGAKASEPKTQPADAAKQAASTPAAEPAPQPPSTPLVLRVMPPPKPPGDGDTQPHL